MGGREADGGADLPCCTQHNTLYGHTHRNIDAMLLPPPLLHSCMYVGFAALFSLLASELVAPTPAGWLARRELAAALRGCGQLVWTACDIASREVGPDGRLTAASGKQSGQLSIDSGLLAEVWPLHAKSSALGTSCQVGVWRRAVHAVGRHRMCLSVLACMHGVDQCSHRQTATVSTPCLQSAMAHIAAARWEVDLYRPTHLLPFLAFWQLGVLARSLLRWVLCSMPRLWLCGRVCHRPHASQACCQSGCGLLSCSSPATPCLLGPVRSAASMLIYQVQSGRLDATHLHRRREQLLAVAAAFQDCCTQAAACLESNAAIGSALQALEQLHSAFIALGDAAGGTLPELWAQPGSLAFSAWFNLMFAAASRVSCVALKGCRCVQVKWREGSARKQLTLPTAAFLLELCTLLAWRRRPPTPSPAPCSCGRSTACCPLPLHATSRGHWLKRRPALPACPTGTSGCWRSWSLSGRWVEELEGV